jgi:phage gp36-like protein
VNRNSFKASYWCYCYPSSLAPLDGPVNPQFANTLEAVCADIALDRLTDTVTVTSSENARNKYKESLALLEKINQEYQGGCSNGGGIGQF